MFTLRKAYYPYVSPFDPCPPMRVKTYPTPPHLYIGFQPPNLPQFPPHEALRRGTLWQPFYDPWFGPLEKNKESGPL
jgi:spore coat protein JA